MKPVSALMALTLTLAPAVCCCLGGHAESTALIPTSVSQIETVESHHHHASHENPSSERADSTSDCGDCEDSNCISCISTRPVEEAKLDQFTYSSSTKIELLAVTGGRAESLKRFSRWVENTGPRRDFFPAPHETLVSLSSLLLI